MSIFDIFRRPAPSDQPPFSNPSRGASVRRSYPAGEWSDLTADWSVAPQSAFNMVHQNLNTLRARARAEAKKNDYAKRFVGMLKNGVVGPDGFNLQCQFVDQGGLDTTANQAFEDHWRLWAEDARNCDVQRRSDFTTLTRQLVGQLATDGEFIVRKVLGGPMGLQLQIIDPYLLDTNYNDELPNGRKVRFGIEITDAGAAVAYHFNQPDDHYAYTTGQRVRVPASEVFHVYLVESVNQYRGLPWLSTPMYRMHMLDGYEEAAIINARVGASKMGIHKSRSPDKYSGEQTAAGGPIEEITPGGIHYMGEHDEWIVHNPAYPQGEFKDFVRQALRGVASGLEVSYPTLANDLEGVNYTSLRHDALTERDIYMGLQSWLIGSFLRPLYNDWLEIRLQSPGGIPIPRRNGGSRSAAVARIDKYRKIRWQGRRWQWVDPAKEMTANREALEMGVTTRAQIIRDQGRDPEEVFKEVELEHERFGPIEPPAPAMAGKPADNEAGSDQSEGDQPD